MSISMNAGTQATTSTQVASSRDLRLDYFRGLALLMIFVDHVAGNGFAALTLRAMGFADAAEVFVFIAGIAGVYAYRRTFMNKGLDAGVRAVFARIRTLYLVHMLMVGGTLIFAMGTMIAGSGFDVIGKLGLQPLLDNPFAAMLRLPFLAYLPHYLDILPLYVVLLATLPAIILGMRFHPLAPLAVAGVSYGLVLFTGMNLPNLGEWGGWFLNPFAWLLLFTIGAAVAQLSIDGFWARLPRSVVTLITVVAAAYVIFAFIGAAPWRAHTGLADIALVESFTTDKSGLSWHRLLDVLAKAWLVAVLVRRDSPFLAIGIGAAISRAGRHSLPIFVIGTFFSLLGSVVLFEAAGTMTAQTVITVGGIAALLLIARLFDGETRSVAGHRPVTRLH